MHWRRAARDPINRFYLTAIAGPVLVVMGILLFDGAPFGPGDSPEAGRATIVLKLFFLGLWILLSVIPTLLVVIGIGLPVIGAMYAKERVSLLRRYHDAITLWPVYLTATVETLILISLFTLVV